MQVIGFLCATLVGISLGIFGSGGSILTVPIMVYLLKINPVDATGYSLFVVGITSSTGAITYLYKKMVNLKTAVFFGVPSIICVFLTRKFFISAIPAVLFTAGTFAVTKEVVIMLLFGILMFIVAFNMIHKSGHREVEARIAPTYNFPRLVLIGIFVGILTGILGVGGGFIIIPALVLYANISVRMSVGTSLLIIAFNSLAGFAEEVLQKHAEMNFYFLLLFTFFSVTGIFIGFRLSLKLKAEQLKEMFGWFILILGIGVIIEVIFLHTV